MNAVNDQYIYWVLFGVLVVLVVLDWVVGREE